MLNKFKRDIVRLEIRALHPENFINRLWIEEVYVENLKKENISTICIDIEAKDLERVKIFAEEEEIKINIVGRSGRACYKRKLKKRSVLYAGVILLVALTYYLSTYLWSVTIATESAVSPYEIRQLLKDNGIVPGMKKSKIDIFQIEKLLCQQNKEIIWAKARIEGTRLKIKIAEKQTPPNIEDDTTPCDLVAVKNGVIKNVYTKSGTAIVKDGDVVNAGDVLVSGIQGKEESTYEVHAEGSVKAETNYERETIIDTTQPKRMKTGNFIVNKYITLFGKKIYLKNGLNNFDNYDKIDKTDSFIKSEYLYEVKEENISEENIEKEIKEVSDKLYSDITINFNKKIKIVDTVRENKEESEGVYKVRVLIIAEEDISMPRAMENSNSGQ